ncbi:unnamed protein product [Dovyalis caffra]|uniref:Uncharacterized protein n=1 Tax=Dovyalis caffra TaxID=77055 RepID=A0AAV1S3U1_9ROSI|nr:unnamed protein product [Dovyalis caffra]
MQIETEEVTKAFRQHAVRVGDETQMGTVFVFFPQVPSLDRTVSDAVSGPPVVDTKDARFTNAGIKTVRPNQILEKCPPSSSEQTQNYDDRFERKNDHQIDCYKSYKVHKTYKHQPKGCS